MVSDCVLKKNHHPSCRLQSAFEQWDSKLARALLVMESPCAHIVAICLRVVFFSAMHLVVV
eukprot:11199344-Lingulodinium_polyedra.AAC.1